MSKSGVKGPKGELGFTDKEVDEAYAWGYQQGFIGGSMPDDINPNGLFGSAYTSGYTEGYTDYTSNLEEEYNNM